ncbi:MAG: nucleotidyltransferase family protein [Dermatophilaceae bacterium]
MTTSQGAPTPSEGVFTLGILLAAGGGRRYGMPKILAEDGRWLTNSVRTLLDGGCDHVLVVYGAAQAPMPPGSSGVHNADWEQGLASSLRAGLTAALGTDARLAVLHLVDLPDITAPVIDRILHAAPPTGLARASYGGVPGHPVAVARLHWQEMIEAVDGDRGANAFLTSRDDVAVVPCGDLASGQDHDYPASGAPHPISTLRSTVHSARCDQSGMLDGPISPKWASGTSLTCSNDSSQSSFSLAKVRSSLA